MKKILIAGLTSFVFMACSGPAKQGEQTSTDTTQTETLQSAYSGEQMYLIKTTGLGDIALGGGWELVENNLPVAHTDTVKQQDAGTGSYLVRLAEAQEFLLADVNSNEIVALTFFTPPFSTEKGISAQTSTFGDLKAAHSIESIWTPDRGTLNVSVKGLPNATFIFENEVLRGLVEGDNLQESSVPDSVKLTKIYLFKPVQ